LTDENDTPQRDEIRRAMYRQLGTWAAADDLIRSMEKANGCSISALLERATDHAKTGFYDVRCTPETFGEYAAITAQHIVNIDGPGIHAITDAEILIPNWNQDHATT